MEQICVNYKTDIVQKISVINPHKKTGELLQGYSEYSIVIFAPIGFAKQYLIKEDNTTIKQGND